MNPLKAAWCSLLGLNNPRECVGNARIVNVIANSGDS